MDITKGALLIVGLTFMGVIVGPIVGFMVQLKGTLMYYLISTGTVSIFGVNILFSVLAFILFFSFYRLIK